MKLTGSQTHLSYGSSWKTLQPVNRVSMADVVDNLVSWIDCHTADRSTIIKRGFLWPVGFCEWSTYCKKVASTCYAHSCITSTFGRIVKFCLVAWTLMTLRLCDKTRIHVMMPCEYILWSASFIWVYLTIFFFLISGAEISVLVTFLLHLASALEACFYICHLIGYERKGLSSLQGIFAPPPPPSPHLKWWIKASGIVV